MGIEDRLNVMFIHCGLCLWFIQYKMPIPMYATVLGAFIIKIIRKIPAPPLKHRGLRKCLHCSFNFCYFFVIYKIIKAIFKSKPKAFVYKVVMKRLKHAHNTFTHIYKYIYILFIKCLYKFYSNNIQKKILTVLILYLKIMQFY